MDAASERDKRKVLSAICHGSTFFSQLLLSAGIPAVLMVVSDDAVVKENAKEALNFHITLWLYSVVIGILMWLLIGWLLIVPLAIFQTLLPIWAIWSSFSRPDTAFRYPLIFRIL